MNSFAARFALTIALGCVSVTFAWAQGDPVVSARDVFDESLIKISASNAKKLRTYPARYALALKRAQTQLQQVGDLTGYQAIDTERERYRAKGSIETTDLNADHAALREVQEEYIEIRRRYRRDKAEAVWVLYETYQEHLRGLQISLTQSGDIEGAVAARDELTRVADSAIIALTQRTLAATSTDGAVGSPEAAGPASGLVERDGVTLYQGGTRPPVDSDIAYREQRVPRTDNSPLGGAVSARISLGTDRDTDESRTHESHSTSTSRTTSDERRVRLALRSSRVDLIRHDVLVVVQYFATPFDFSSSGSRDPIEVRQHRVRVDRLDSEDIYLDFPAVLLRAASREVIDRHKEDRASRWGWKFHGYGITVFDTDESVIFQASSLRSLGSRLLTERPRGQWVAPEAAPKKDLNREMRDRNGARRKGPND